MSSPLEDYEDAELTRAKMFAIEQLANERRHKRACYSLLWWGCFVVCCGAAVVVITLRGIGQ